MSLIDDTSVEVQNLSDTHKTRAIVAHMTLIGWIIALVQNNNDKNQFPSFYIRQMLGLIIVGIALNILTSIIVGIIPSLIVVMILSYGTLAVLIAAWIHSLIGAVNAKEQLTPVVGKMFQDWFKSL